MKSSASELGLSVFFCFFFFSWAEGSLTVDVSSQHGELLKVGTCFIGTLSVESSRDSDNVLNFCLETIKINSVLVVFRASLLQRSHLWMLLKSRF